MHDDRGGAGTASALVHRQPAGVGVDEYDVEGWSRIGRFER